MASVHREDTPPNGRQVTPTGAGLLLFQAANSIQSAIRKEQAAGA